MVAERVIIPPNGSDAARKKGQVTNAAFARGKMINHAATIEESLMEAVGEMREQLSQSAPVSEESASAAAERRAGVRAAAGTLARLAVGWDTVLDRVRVIQGKPLPGQKRPMPDELKVPKPRKLNLPPDPV